MLHRGKGGTSETLRARSINFSNLGSQPRQEGNCRGPQFPSYSRCFAEHDAGVREFAQTFTGIGTQLAHSKTNACQSQLLQSQKTCSQPSSSVRRIARTSSA